MLTKNQSIKLQKLAKEAKKIATSLKDEQEFPFGTAACFRSDAGKTIPCCAFGHALSNAGFEPKRTYALNMMAMGEFLRKNLETFSSDEYFALRGATLGVSDANDHNDIGALRESLNAFADVAIEIVEANKG